MFVFRNYTIENLFDEPVRFSGYDNLSDIPESDSYLWFYIAPIGTNNKQTIAEINGIVDKLKFVADSIPSSTPFYILTLENLFKVVVSDTDRIVDKAIKTVNDLAWEIASERTNVRVIDFGEFLSLHNPDTWINWKFYFMSQMIISPSIAPAFKDWWRKRFPS